VLAVILVALVVSGVLAAQVAGMSVELARRSNTIELQNQEIEQHLAAIATKNKEMEAKSVQLDALNREIAARSLEAESLGIELSAQAEQLARLQTQAARLQTEISLLQSKILLDEQYVTSLSKQLELTRENAKRVKISHYSLAVRNGIAIAFPIEVEVINSGTGAISVDVSNAQYEPAFQDAVRTAAAVASEYTGEPISDMDIFVRIINDQSEGALTKIDGSSAGALIAGMLVAALTDKAVSDKVMVTGTINPNGTIGRVNNIEEKAEAAIDLGANMLLVPNAQQFDSTRIVVKGVLDIDDIVRYLVVSN
jgi:predicted ATP-dependent protease